MKKYRGSTAAKITAFLLVGISAMIFMVSLIGTAAIYESGAYTQSKESYKDAMYDSITDNYSKAALNQFISGNTDTGYFTDKHFEYGILKADSIDDLNLTDKHIYDTSTFSGKLSADSLVSKKYTITGNTSFHYDYQNNWLGVPECYLSEDGGIATGIDYIYYDLEKGIFYYGIGDDYYPIRMVSLEIDTNGSYLDLQYDVSHKAYVCLTHNSVIADETASALIAGNNYLTLDKLNGTHISYRDWSGITLDNVYYVPEYINFSSGSANSTNTLTTDYSMASDNSIYIAKPDADKQITYWVVSSVPTQGFSTTLDNWIAGDGYVRADILSNLAYGFRYPVFAILILSFLIMLLSGIFCFYAAGYQAKTASIQSGIAQRFPLDVLTILVFIVLVMGLSLISEFLGVFRLSTLIESCVVGFVLYVIGMLYLLDVAILLKCGLWWKNTLCHRTFTFLRKNLSLVWKGWICFCIISLYEFIFILTLEDFLTQRVFLFWLFEKAILFVLLTFFIAQMKHLQKGSEELANGNLSHKINTDKMYWEFKKHGDNLNRISEGMGTAVEERMKSEHFKTELITNVSHDIKTPLTSIINYVDLLGKEHLDNENARRYLEVLERQSTKLKKLIEDLIEASKASTGNLAVNFEKLEAGVFVTQIVGEFEEKMAISDLDLVMNKPEQPLYILADGRHLWRVIDNLMNNICKYAQPGTRVYLDLALQKQKAVIFFRNTSKSPLNISSEELMERFVRGDSSRNTEGSGLGLSIAKSLTELMNGSFQIQIDGDLFKTVLTFDILEEPETACHN